MIAQRVLFSGFLSVLSISITVASGISFQDAVKQNKVKATIYGLIGGSHTGKSINVDLVNNTSASITVKLDPGQVLLPGDTSVQSMMVVQEEVITLAPGKAQKLLLYAFCVEKNDGGPGVNDTFSVGPTAQGALLKMAQFLNEKKLFDDGVQNAIWCITDGDDVESITCRDTKLTNELRQLTASLTAQKFVAYEAPSQTQPLPERIIIRTTTTTTPPYKQFKGGVDLYAPPGTEIRIVLIDDQGKEVREFYKDNTGGSARQMSFPFELDGRTLEGKMYFVRYYIGGQRVRDIPVNNMKLKSVGF